jgi:electron transfer flavoprotein alpha/beta subunit
VPHLHQIVCVQPGATGGEDRRALELALQLRERHGGTVTTLTLGREPRGELLRDCLCRGADRAVLVLDARPSVGDTLATATILALAARRLEPAPRLVLCGWGATGGMVGLQLAELLDLPHLAGVTGVSELVEEELAAQLQGDVGVAEGRTPLPALLAVASGAPALRPGGARRIMHWRRARLSSEVEPAEVPGLQDRGLLLEQWDLEALGATELPGGAEGARTQVVRVQELPEHRDGHTRVEPTPEGLAAMVQELFEERWLA